MAAVLATLVLASVSPLASAAPARFGSNLARSADPSANSTLECPDPGQSCTWIMGEAWQRDSIKAPKRGTIRKIRVMAYDEGGRFRPVLARVKDHGNKAKIVRRGPLLTYEAQPDIDEFPYVVQTFSVNMSVKKGDVLGIEARRTSLLNCSGQFTPQFQPKLRVGDSFRTKTSDAGCILMIEAVYGPS
jgi:hypothetical protein